MTIAFMEENILGKQLSAQKPDAKLDQVMAIVEGDKEEEQSSNQSSVSPLPSDLHQTQQNTG